MNDKPENKPQFPPANPTDGLEGDPTVSWTPLSAAAPAVLYMGVLVAGILAIFNLLGLLEYLTSEQENPWDRGPGFGPAIAIVGQAIFYLAAAVAFGQIARMIKKERNET